MDYSPTTSWSTFPSSTATDGSGSRPRGSLRAPLLFAAAAGLLLSACSDSSSGPDREPGFLDGVPGNPEMALVVNTLENAVRIFPLGDPSLERVVELGAGETLTPTSLSVGERDVLVPLGNAASVALVNPETQEVPRFFVFERGNATGSVFTGSGEALVANLDTDEIGRILLTQGSDRINETVAVAPRPTALVMAGDRVAVLSSNLDENFAPLGEGVVTILDPGSLTVLAEVETGGTNPTSLSVGPDGLLYVVHAENFVREGSVAVVDPEAGTLLEVVPGFGVGPGSIHVDGQGLAYVSGFFLGTVVWDTRSGTFLRGPSDPVCAPLAGGGCRGASAATTDRDGRLYQVFFGSPAEGVPGQIFVYEGSGFTLTDSIPAGEGPTDLVITTF